MLRMTPLQRRRWQAFRRNGRAIWSLRLFLLFFVVALCAEFVANDKPLLVSYRGELMTPVFSFHAETEFGGDFATEAEYSDPSVQCLIISGGQDVCFDDPRAVIEEVRASGTVDGAPVEAGWILWPPIPYSYDTVNYDVERAPSAPDGRHWLGTDDRARDVMATVIYGFRLSILFALVVAVISSAIGILAGAAQGYFGGWVDLVFQRFVEIWGNTPSLYVLIILSAMFTMNFWLLTLLIAFFGWTALVGVVRAEFLRARNFEYVRAARALGVGDWTIMLRHVLPNAMVATLTMLPFIITGAIAGLATLDYLGLGLAAGYPSLGDLTLQGKNNLQAPWLGFTAFFTFAIMLSLLVFIFEGVRDAFDPRKTLT